MSDSGKSVLQNRSLAIMLIAGAVAVFACVDAMTKHLATAWNVPLVVAMRYIVNVLALAAIYAPGQGRALIATKRTGLVMLRALCLSAASLFAGLALTRMPVAETLSIIFLAPFVVMVLAISLLGEKVSAQGWISAAIGFTGVLIIANPGNGLDPVGVFYAACCAAVTVGYYLLSRLLASTESAMAMLFHTALVGAVLFGLYLPWSLHGPMPGTLDMSLFVLIGLAATLGHFLFTTAFRHAPASFLAPFNYMHLFWAGIVGWLVFDHVPGTLTLVGMALVAAAGVAAALAPRQTTAKEDKPVIEPVLE